MKMHACWDRNEVKVQEVPIEICEEEKKEASSPNDSSKKSTSDESSTEVLQLRRSTRVRTPNPRYPDDIFNCQFALAVSDPLYYEEAVKKEEWQKAMLKEIKAIEKNETWEMVELPKDKSAIDFKWVYMSKFVAHGSLQKHKARLVEKGYAQQYGVDFEETFSPVAWFETVRLVLALATQLKWSVYQFDANQQFLMEICKKKSM